MYISELDNEENVLTESSPQKKAPENNKGKLTLEFLKYMHPTFQM